MLTTEQIREALDLISRRVLILEAKMLTKENDNEEVSHLRKKVQILEKEVTFLCQIRDEKQEQEVKLWAEINRLRAFEAATKAGQGSGDRLE